MLSLLVTAKLALQITRLQLRARPEIGAGTTDGITSLAAAQMLLPHYFLQACSAAINNSLSARGLGTSLGTT